ncbi:MAG: class I SAM-dependent methyltransferase [Pseudomonadota bacterium]|nr:class I SAM-dependent methyltransferase [Pseudomonadota bacterium]
MGEPDASREFGDVAARYAALRPAYPAELFAFLLDRLDGRRERAVDLGAGSGQASRALVGLFPHVTAVEPDARMLAHLDAPVAERINLPAEEADFAAGSVDAVVAATSFHWMDQERVCASVARWLRPGGVFFPFLYTPFAPQGPAQAIYERHWRLWLPHMDRRLGAKADYSRAIRESGAFGKIEMFSSRISASLSPAEATGLLSTASYARAYMAQCGDAEGYLRGLEGELAAVGERIDVVFPLGGVLAVRRSD